MVCCRAPESLRMLMELQFQPLHLSTFYPRVTGVNQCHERYGSVRFKWNDHAVRRGSISCTIKILEAFIRFFPKSLQTGILFLFLPIRISLH